MDNDVNVLWKYVKICSIIFHMFPIL
jgi:hypothetical protein